MNKLNKYVQYFIIAVGIILGLVSLFDNQYIYFLLLWFMPLGFTQYLGSLAHMIAHKGKSQFTIHFIVSTLTLLFIMIGSESWRVINVPYKFEKIVVTISAVMCVGLAAYYWYLTFRPTVHSADKKHSVYDL